MAACPPAGAAASGLTLDVASNRADLVSAGDALVRVGLPPGTSPRRVRITLDGDDVTGAFVVRERGRLEGLVEGLEPGRNVLEARTRAGPRARLVITNHPNGGPIFAGPQVQPWACRTEAAGLGPAADAQCNAPVRIRYFYKHAASGRFEPFDAADPPASADVAVTTTDEGRTVPYVIREETGVQDRGIYAIAVLADPARPWTFDQPQETWNRKVMWLFGAGSNAHHAQGPVGDVRDDGALARGFMVASSALNTHHYNANATVSAEAVMMLKERIAERYGAIRHTIGIGCSGGALQQYVIASMYPGLLDGLIPSCSFPDVWSQNAEIADCKLLVDYFTATPGLWSDAGARSAAMGKGPHDGCTAWADSYAWVFNDPTASRPMADCAVPRAEIYDPLTNPHGVRCSFADYQVAIWGRRAQDGFAKRVFDNVGVQYGLQALRAGDVTPEQFVHLNEHVGGVDIDFRPQPARTVADPGTLSTAYRSQITDGRRLAAIPILELRGHDTVEWHQDYNSYEIRARLDEANGGHDNHVIWTGAAPMMGDPAFDCAILPFVMAVAAAPLPPTTPGGCSADPLGVMDDWLTRIEADRTSRPPALKVARAKPAAAADACWIDGQRIADAATCRAAYPYYGSTRNGAGAPLTNDTLKCRLAPLNRAAYGATFTDEQWARLRATFPDGACDWSRPGVDQQPAVPWLTFADGPGGRPLGSPPRTDRTRHG